MTLADRNAEPRGTGEGAQMPGLPGAPRVTIGFLAYNEERWMAQSLESLLAQTFRDFELVIYDNASTDGTAEIARSFAQRDPRVRHHRQERNLGAVENGNDAMRRARGTYVLLAGGHDLWSPNYIEGLTTALDANPKAVLAFGRSVYIDAEGAQDHPVKGLYSTEGVTSPVRRFNICMWANQEPFLGLIRTEALRQTHYCKQIITPVQVMLHELAILGQFIYVHDVTFHRRRNREKEDRGERVQRYLSSLFMSRGAKFLPHWRACWAIILAAWQTKLGGKKRRQLRVQLLLSSLTSFIRFMPYLWEDVGRAFTPWRSARAPRDGAD